MIKVIYNNVPYKIYGKKVLVHLNVHNEEGVIICDEALLPCSSKDVLISSLIKMYYPQDLMDAIRNNYELVKDGTAGDKAEEYTQEYLAMQEWRAYSKQLAAEIMASKEANSN